MIAMQAELTQTPFDMPIAESELVAGYQVEYTGIRFLVYFIAEFATAVGFAAVAVDAVPRRLGAARRRGASADDAMHVHRSDRRSSTKAVAPGRRRVLGPLQLPPLP